MKGYKTWLAVLGSFSLSAFSFISGDNKEGLNYLILGLGFLGIGSKIDKGKETLF